MILLQKTPPDVFIQTYFYLRKMANFVHLHVHTNYSLL